MDRHSVLSGEDSHNHVLAELKIIKNRRGSFEEEFPNSEVISNLPDTLCSIMTRDYKLISGHGKEDSEELYDLRKDPLETVNLIEEYPKLAQALKETLEDEITKARKRE